MKPNRGNLAIQIGSYSEIAQAQERVSQLKSIGIETRMLKTAIPKRGNWYRVQAGRFIERSEAEQFGAELQAKGVITTFAVVRYQPERLQDSIKKKIK